MMTNMMPMKTAVKTPLIAPHHTACTKGRPVRASAERVRSLHGAYVTAMQASTESTCQSTVDTDAHARPVLCSTDCHAEQP